MLRASFGFSLVLAFSAVAAAQTIQVADPRSGPGHTITFGDIVNNPELTIQTITQSVSQSITLNNGIACSAGGLASDNQFYRSFALSTFGITQPYTVSSVGVGIETNTQTTPFPFTVTVFSDTDNNPANGLGAQIGTGAGAAPASLTNGAIVNVPIVGGASTTNFLVVRWSYLASTTGGMWPGTNTLGQTGPTYISSTGCGLPNPTDMAAINFPNVHWVLNVTGDVAPEPSTLALLGFGALSLIRRRR